MKATSLLIKNRMKATTEFRDRLYLQRRIWNRVLLAGLIALFALPILLFLMQ